VPGGEEREKRDDTIFRFAFPLFSGRQPLKIVEGRKGKKEGRGDRSSNAFQLIKSHSARWKIKGPSSLISVIFSLTPVCSLFSGGAEGESKIIRTDTEQKRDFLFPLPSLFSFMTCSVFASEKKEEKKKVAH